MTGTTSCEVVHDSDPPVEHTVTRKKVTTGYQALVAEGMQNMAFEAVVLRRPELFTDAAVKQSRERIAQWHADED